MTWYTADKCDGCYNFFPYEIDSEDANSIIKRPNNCTFFLAGNEDCPLPAGMDHIDNKGVTDDTE